MQTAVTEVKPHVERLIKQKQCKISY